MPPSGERPEWRAALRQRLSGRCYRGTTLTTKGAKSAEGGLLREPSPGASFVLFVSFVVSVL